MFLRPSGYFSFHPGRFLILLSLLGVMSVLIISARYGIGLSPDSVIYIAGARNLIAGQGYVSFDGLPITLWPPLYSAFLGFFGFLLSTDPLTLAPGLQALLYGLNLYLSGALFLRHTKSVHLTLLGLLLAASWPLTKISSMAWSESLFLSWILLFLLSMEFYLRSSSFRWLVTLSVCAGLAGVTRYLGISLIFTGVILLILHSGKSWKTRVAHIVFFALVSAMPLLLWGLRNRTVCGSVFGPRYASQHAFLENVLQIVERINFWFLSEYIPLNPALVVASLVIVLSIIATALNLLRNRSSHAERMPLRETVLTSRHLTIFILCYLGTVLLTATFSIVDIGSRMISPVYVPLFLVCLILIQKYIAVMEGRWRRWSPRHALLVIGWILAFGALAEIIGITAFRVLKGGGGYNTTAWRKNETLQNLSLRFAPSDTLYSNAPDAIYILCGRSARWIPSKRGYDSEQKALADLPSLWPPLDQIDLVWFDRVKRDYLFSIAELETTSEVSRRARFSDGAVFRVSRKMNRS